MGMPENVARQWKIVEVCLKNYGIYRSLDVDVLLWKDIKGVPQLRVKDIYLKLITSGNAIPNSFFPLSFWKSGCVSKSIFFSWLVFQKKNLSWENLRKRGWQGPSLCPVCRTEEERNCHMFLLCVRSQQLWQALEIHYGFPHASHTSIQEPFIW